MFQPFFLQADLPYSAIRGEEFPVKVALYNYLDTPQADHRWRSSRPTGSTCSTSAQKTVTVAGGDIGSAEFKIRPTDLGTQLREGHGPQRGSGRRRDQEHDRRAGRREPGDGGERGASGRARPARLSLALPAARVVPDSARAYVAVTGSLLAQTIDGLDQLLQMPFGCGEQNMILFAPDVFIPNYLQGTGQLKPEILAKAELLLITGYQRELTYRRDDGSFSAFGEQDKEGSLWLTAFVLKTFAQAKDLIFIDEAVLVRGGRRGSPNTRQADGSFESVGFVHHQDMLGGVQGKDALTAYVAIALLEAGETAAADKAIDYLAGRLDAIDDPYALALTTYALELGKSAQAAAGHGEAHGRGHRGRERPPLEPAASSPSRSSSRRYRPAEAGLMDVGQDAAQPRHRGHRLRDSGPHRSTATASNASRAAKWLVGQRNSQGGFGSTQDTVVALQALTAVRDPRRDRHRPDGDRHVPAT